MHTVLGLLAAAFLGIDGAPPPYTGPSVQVMPAKESGANRGPLVAFEIREIRVASPDWRGKLMPQLQPIARQEGTAVWRWPRLPSRNCSKHARPTSVATSSRLPSWWPM